MLLAVLSIAQVILQVLAENWKIVKESTAVLHELLYIEHLFQAARVST